MQKMNLSAKNAAAVVVVGVINAVDAAIVVHLNQFRYIRLFI